MNKQDVNVGPVERLLSVGAGAALLWHSLTDRKEAKMSGFVSGILLLRGLTGRSLLYEALGIRRAGEARDNKRGIKVSEMITINAPADELYRHWRNLQNLPKIMPHLLSVEELDGKRSLWRAKGPAGTVVEWEAEIVQDFANELIAWQSVGNATVTNAGSVSFRELMGTGETEVKVILRYDPPGGAVGGAIAGVLGEEPSRQIRKDLLEFKRMVEFGELLAPVKSQEA